MWAVVRQPRGSHVRFISHRLTSALEPWKSPKPERCATRLAEAGFATWTKECLLIGGMSRSWRAKSVAWCEPTGDDLCSSVSRHAFDEIRIAVHFDDTTTSAIRSLLRCLRRVQEPMEMVSHVKLDRAASSQIAARLDRINCAAVSMSCCMEEKPCLLWQTHLYHGIGLRE